MVAVAIGIVVRERRVLICRRPSGTPLAGYWEFPGGKCRPEESPEACLERELMEELAIQARIVRAFAPIEYAYPTQTIRLHPFLCESDAGEPQALAAAEVRWADAQALAAYRFPPANDHLIREVIELLQTSTPKPD